MQDPMIAAFEKWFKEFLESENNRLGQTTTEEEFQQQFPSVYTDIKEGFRQGWLRCEDFYADEIEIIVINPKTDIKNSLN